MNLDLHKIKSVTFVFVTLLIVGVICPGILFVFTFGKNIFLTTDTFKLTLLCTSITIPIWLINCLFHILIDDGANKSNDMNFEIQTLSIVGSLMTIPVVYTPILVKIFFNISLQIAVVICFAVQLIICLIFLFLELLDRKQKSK